MIKAIKNNWLVSLGLVAVLLSLVLYWIKSKGGTFKSLDASDKLPERGSSLSSLEAIAIADNMYKALVSYLWGTDEKLFYAQLDKLKTQQDFNAVYNAFGLRKYSTTWGNQGDPITTDNHNLIFIIIADLKKKEQTFVKMNYPFLRIF